MTPTISVLMPVYNGQEHLREAMDSILGQTCRDFEFIVVNDGSTDGSREILRAYEKADSRVTVVDIPNSDIVGALNVGLSYCSGLYVARMDADDISLPDRLLRQKDYLDRNPRVVICGSDVRAFGDREYRIRLPATDAGCRGLLYFYPCFMHPAVMMRRRLFDAHHLRYRAEYQYAEDYDLWVRAAQYGLLGNIRDVLLLYRIHSSQITSTKLLQQKGVHSAVSRRVFDAAGIQVSQELITSLVWPPSGAGTRLRLMAALFGLFARLAARGTLSVRMFGRLAKALMASRAA